MSDLQDTLAAMFADDPMFEASAPPAELSYMQVRYWDGLVQGHPINKVMLAQSREYKQVVELFYGATGKATHNGQTYWQRRQERARQRRAENRQDAADFGLKRRPWLSQDAHTQVINQGLDAIQAGNRLRTNHYLERVGVSADDARAIARYDRTAMNETALESLKGHDVMKTVEAGMQAAVGIHHGTTASCLGKVRDCYHAGLGVLAAIQAEQKRQAAKVAELEAKLAQHDKRIEMVEAGTDWKAEALRMKAAGNNASEIGRALGQNPATVRKHLSRAKGEVVTLVTPQNRRVTLIKKEQNELT
ncbi:hypothetical protein [Pseudomonas avellanae]|nr:hypothetical protein [Pseudomonas avellanae]EKG30962.1 hypothetical protein Pav631_3747 [Pseudomonas avellanae BPIC 631]UQW71002.1 hypothetical protein L2Y00_11545 [Pseudomonas avellanae]GGJ41905.1 hypothetical protein GCM10009085_39740 [Pseudomonas avellanae]